MLALPLLAPPGYADSPRGREADKERKEYRHQEREREQHRVIVIRKPQWHQASSPRYRERTTIIVPRDRYVWGTHVRRPHGRPYHGYGFYFSDDDAFQWLAFTAITLKILDNLNEEQQRLHEAAQVRATTANVGEVIMWEEGNAYGSVATTRRGTTTTGRPCREFQQTVTIGGRTEQAYGTACMNPDGSWEVVP
ncbi:MAG: hypothetical protein R6X15_04200 [Pseudomonadota bacterium]